MCLFKKTQDNDQNFIDALCFFECGLSQSMCWLMFLSCQTTSGFIIPLCVHTLCSEPSTCLRASGVLCLPHRKHCTCKKNIVYNFFVLNIAFWWRCNWTLPARSIISPLQPLLTGYKGASKTSPLCTCASFNFSLDLDMLSQLLERYHK